MLKIKCMILSTLFFTLLMSLYSLGYCNEIDEADAQSITLSNIRLLDSSGSYPSLSPRGDEVIFTKVETIKGDGFKSIWLMDLNGKNKKRLISHAYNGVFSPDGSKISFCTSVYLSPKSRKEFCIYDIKTKKVFEIAQMGVACAEATFRWTKDSEKILREGPAVKTIINLDTLKEEDVNNKFADYSGKTKFSQNYDNWKKNNILTNEHSKVRIFAGGMHKSTGLVQPGALWVENRDESYKKLLLGETFWLKENSVHITPDIKKIIYEVKDKGIYIADLSVSKEKKNIMYSIDIGLNDYASADSNFERAFKETTIWASISEPKINPLNGKTIGAGDKLKAWGQIVKLIDGKTVLRIRVEMSPIVPGDVVHNIRANIKNLGDLEVNKLWAVLKLYSDDK